MRKHHWSKTTQERERKKNHKADEPCLEWHLCSASPAWRVRAAPRDVPGLQPWSGQWPLSPWRLGPAPKVASCWRNWCLETQRAVHVRDQQAPPEALPTLACWPSCLCTHGHEATRPTSMGLGTLDAAGILPFTGRTHRMPQVRAQTRVQNTLVYHDTHLQDETRFPLSRFLLHDQYLCRPFMPHWPLTCGPVGVSTALKSSEAHIMPHPPSKVVHSLLLYDKGFTKNGYNSFPFGEIPEHGTIRSKVMVFKKSYILDRRMAPEVSSNIPRVTMSTSPKTVPYVSEVCLPLTWD